MPIAPKVIMSFTAYSRAAITTTRLPVLIAGRIEPDSTTKILHPKIGTVEKINNPAKTITPAVKKQYIILIILIKFYALWILWPLFLLRSAILWFLVSSLLPSCLSQLKSNTQSCTVALNNISNIRGYCPIQSDIIRVSSGQNQIQFIIGGHAL